MAAKTKKPAAKQQVTIGLPKGGKKGTKKAPAKAKAKKDPGMIDSIVERLTAAIVKAPLSKDELVKKLAARFKDRDAKALKTTVNCQVGRRLEEGRKVKVIHVYRRDMLSLANGSLQVESHRRLPPPLGRLGRRLKCSAFTRPYCINLPARTKQVEE
jgi:hypothetical protein